jgi:diphthine-ammonia ligase
MRLGVLFSGGKDSTYALNKAMEFEEVICLISIFSKNSESFMFHTPNIEITRLQAEAIGLPLVEQATAGFKEKELADLKKAVQKAMKEHKIEGIVTGAIESVYQAERIQKICGALGLWCFNPLWKKDQETLVREIISEKFNAIISGVFAYPLTKDFLGRKINEPLLKELLRLRDKYKISPSGEGGEIETTVLDAPLFKKKIEILDYEITGEKNSFVFNIRKARLVSK